MALLTHPPLLKTLQAPSPSFAVFVLPRGKTTCCNAVGRCPHGERHRSFNCLLALSKRGGVKQELKGGLVLTFVLAFLAKWG
ncbi:hypothetical protein AUJ65_05410 [Candidatus Micrarchaeota archaeon CG1_02_51_15]|nr:MAG: hypothetical protein AUJ65_05410 [Candidatus Micrarchaeota archaeon CG1_02_51_15]